VPYPVAAVDEAAGRCVGSGGDAMSETVLAVPCVGVRRIGECVAVGVVGVVGSPPRQEHIGIVDGVVLRPIYASACIGLACSIAHRVEAVALRLSIPVVHRLEPVQFVVAVQFGAERAIAAGNLIGETLSRSVVGVVVLEKQAALPHAGRAAAGVVGWSVRRMAAFSCRQFSRRIVDKLGSKAHSRASKEVCIDSAIRKPARLLHPE